MAISVRIYIFADDGSLRRVPRRISENLPFGKDAIPEFADTRQRVVQVLLENEERRPVRILDATGHFWTFDSEGRIDAGLRDSMSYKIEAAFAPLNPATGKVVDLVPEIKKKKVRDHHRWDLTNEDLNRIAADIWPGVNGPAPEVSSVSGKTPKKPPLSHEAKFALREIDGRIESIKDKMLHLNEHALKGLEFEARRTASFEDEHLWIAVAEEARRHRELLSAHRTGKGEWYAVVEATRIEDRIIAKTVAVAHEKCATRPEAIEAARRLMAEKIGWLGPDICVEVAVYSVLEWQPDDHEAST